MQIVQEMKWPKDERYIIYSDGTVRGAKGKMLVRSMSLGYHVLFAGRSGMQKVSRLVATCFVVNPNPKKFKVVNHINGIKKDDRAENLEWCDQAYNVKHAKDAGLFLTNTGSNHYLAKLDEIQVKTIKRCFKDGLTNLQLGRYFKVDRQTIRSIRVGKSWVGV